ncbi:hypothetical protein GCM10011371_01390 [Novosphingobium marinum]|uniref:Exoprotein n=1 Tax=Novosphingobium marinum TaxID=1514948 RepID=A0A7Z0BRG8_9SPHN|nr:YdbH domain-containing protein [Novosphingobium marinum]NYH93831.1 hypothetical protein [Novosphingobium marinum]GGC17606.1 hypothetical protein GCM10011371_01390 [Novosphingobium marinum]
MSQADDELLADQEDAHAPADTARSRRFRWRYLFIAFVVLLSGAVVFAWFSRERIANDIISGELEKLDVPAQYEIVSIGAGRQVLENVIFGDPDRPDLTIDRVEVAVSAGFSGPRIGRIRLVRPRLYGSMADSRLSFGSVDPLIYTGSDEPFRLPDLDIAIEDGRALLETEFGRLGVKAEGQGELRDGFAGIVAVFAPDLAVAGCEAGRATLYGRVHVSGERPRFAGPVRLADMTCPDEALSLAQVAIQVDTTFDRALDGAEGQAGLDATKAGYGSNRLARIKGETRFTYRDDALTANFDVEASGVRAAQIGARALSADGVVRAARDFARVESEGTVTGEGLALGDTIDGALSGLQESVGETLLDPLLSRMRTALQREQPDSSLSGSYLVRRTGQVTNVVVPRATLRGGSGETLFALSRFQMTQGGSGVPRLSGNFSTGGRGLPDIAGRMERRTGNGIAMRIRMAPYESEGASLSIPSLLIVQSDGGGIGFAGRLTASGAIPGGTAQGLSLPVDGNWSGRSGLSLWRRCVDVQFDRLALGDVSFGRRSVELCPARGRAIVRSGPEGLRIAAGAPSLELAGMLGETPIRIASGPLGVAYPGLVSARSLRVAIGPEGTATRFDIENLQADLGSSISGTFEDADILIDAVPLDILEARGAWTYEGDVLRIADAAFTLKDRESDARFQPLISQDATLVLADNEIAADAVLREPTSMREIVRTKILHDLATGRGNADLIVDGILFDEDLQPDTITRLALGVVANVDGVVTGRGGIRWDEDGVESLGRFSTQSLDLAAAFGPVEGLSGTVRFTDLLGLVTAPDQVLHVAAINPGIEVNDGIFRFELQPDYVLQVVEGAWPFLDGKLTLQPVTMKLGVAETRRYTLVIEGLNAAKFVDRMELANLSATGTFDGVMPLVFDEDGGRIDNGQLRSRPPGGNVSYVGELSYEDLSTMANFAFDALKSLDYREMTIGMDGSLEGEIVTRVRFYGVSQGEGARRNFITRRVANLPLQFNVNVRAPFFNLISSFKSLYDPAYVRDPRELGLLDTDGNRVAPSEREPTDPFIQPPESEEMP